MSEEVSTYKTIIAYREIYDDLLTLMLYATVSSAGLAKHIAKAFPYADIYSKKHSESNRCCKSTDESHPDVACLLVQIAIKISTLKKDFYKHGMLV